MPSPVPTDPVARRHLLIGMALRRARPGSGSSLELLRSRTWRHAVYPLRTIISVPFVVVGGVATRLYAPERMTDDLDVLVAVTDAKRFYGELAGGGGRRLGDLSIPGSSWRLSDGTLLDVLESDAPWVPEAISRPVIAPDGSPIVRLPYLVLLKLRAGRTTDIGDVSRMLGGADEAALEDVRVAVGVYHPEDRDDLESLIQLGRLEYRSGLRAEETGPWQP